MELHEFMCPEVFDHEGSHVSSGFDTYPSQLLMWFDPSEGGTIHLKGKTFKVGDDRSTYGKYKAFRNEMFIKQTASRVKSPILVDLEDCREYDSDLYFGHPLNVLQYNRRVGSRTGVLWRLPYYFDPSHMMGHVDNRMITDDLRLADKIPKVFWRGDLSGSRWLNPYARTGVFWKKCALGDVQNFAAHYSRPRAVFYSAQNPTYTDFKFAGSNAETVEGLREAGFVVDRSEPSEALKYKYVLCPNGNDVASQTYWVAKTNSVIFREDCAYEVLPDYWLKPWVHYVPISRGLADMREKFLYCEAHQDLCARITRQANVAYEQMINPAVWEEAENIVLDRLSRTKRDP